MSTSIFRRALLTLAALVVCTSAYAQGDVNLVSIDTVFGQVSADQIEAGECFLWFRYATDVATGGVAAAANNFLMYSPDAASISNIGVLLVNGTLPGGLEDHDLLAMTYVTVANSGSWTDMQPASVGGFDTVGINLLVLPLEGRGPLPAGEDFVLYGLRFTVEPCDAGLHICIDTTHSLPPTGAYQWEWYAVNPPSPVYPDWTGVRCFEIVNSGPAPAECCCLPPTVGDIDQSGVVDITDVSILVDNQFLTLTPLICEAEGDCDFSGVVDISDLSILIDNQFLTLTPLPPCP